MVIKNHHRILMVLSILAVSTVLALVNDKHSQAAGNTYYVATNGNNNNSCAQAQNINTPKQTLTAGATCLTAGDTLLVRAGTYDEAITSMPSGTSWSNKVRVANYNGEVATIKPTHPYSNVVLCGSENCTEGGHAVAFWRGEKYIEFDGINMDGSDAGNHGGAFLGLAYNVGNNPGYIRVKNAEMISYRVANNIPPAQPPQVMVVTGHDVGHWELINLKIHGGGASACTDILESPRCSGYGIYFATSNSLIENSDIYDTGGGGIHVYSYGYNPHDNIIRNNRIRDMTISWHSQTFGILVAGGNNQVYNNLIYGLEPPTFSGAAISVYSGNAVGNKLWNNTIYNNNADGISLDVNSSNSEIRNNLIYNNVGNPLYTPAPGTTQDHNLINTNPLFTNPGAGDFYLQSGSPAKNTGTTISSVTTDFAGTPRPQEGIYDIGAYEYGGTITPPPPPPPSGPPSPSGTRVPTSANITDNSGNVWTIGSNQTILRNGVSASGGLGSQILWYQNTIYVLGTNDQWFEWTGNGWIHLGPNDPSGSTPLLGDINLDHIVNSIDYSILNSQWFTTNPQSDLNQDGLVNSLDFSILNSNWFRTW